MNLEVAERSRALSEGTILPDTGTALGAEHAAALREALLGGETHYTPRPGLPELREEVARRLETAGAPPGGEVVITGGRKEALFVALAGMEEPVRLSERTAADPVVIAALAALGRSPALSGLSGNPVVDLGDRFPEVDLTGIPEGAVLLGSLDGFPELAPFRLGFFRAPDALLPKLRGLKQAISICTAAPSQRAAALVLGARKSKRLPEIRTRKDDSRYSLMELAAGLDDVVSLGRGDPDADAPAPVLEKACAALGETEPLHPRGQPWLLERIADREEARTGVRPNPETEVLVTGGAQEGIVLAMLGLLGEGEEALLADPYYTSYIQAIALAKGRPALVPASEGADFGMRAEATAETLRQAERPRLLVIVNFSNPTGARTHAEEVEGLCRLASRERLWVLSDEVYGDMALDGKGPILSPVSLPGMREQTLTLGSVSKSYAMTGFRIGYLTGPAEAIAACARLKAAISGPAPLFSQRAAAAALAGGEAFPARMREIYAPRRELLLDGLRKLGIPTTDHGGGFFVWADISRFGMPAEAFCRRLLTEARVLMFPGTAFGKRWDRYIRISMLQTGERIAEALDRMRNFGR